MSSDNNSNYEVYTLKIVLLPYKIVALFLCNNFFFVEGRSSSVAHIILYSTYYQ